MRALQISLFTLLLTLLAGCDRKYGRTSRAMTATKYQIGEVWNYHTRGGEEQSRVFIVRADPHEKLGTIYHVHIDGLKIRNPRIAGGIQNDLPHSPVSEKTLDESVTTLSGVHTGEMPDVSEGYGIWKEAFNKGEAGIFTIPVNQVVQYIEDAVNDPSNR